MQTQEGTPLIQLENIYKNFGKAQILKGINLHIKEGEKLVIIGPSGSGKSTLIRCMNCLEEPTSGRILIDGEVLTKRTGLPSTGNTPPWFSSSLTCIRI